jgi:hypothetical protein
MAANPAVHCKDQGGVAVEQPGDGSPSLAPGNLIQVHGKRQKEVTGDGAPVCLLLTFNRNRQGDAQ